MPCPTCDHTMHRIGPIKDGPIFWCPRCGTLLSEGDESVPMLVSRVKALKEANETSKTLGGVWYGFSPVCHQLGIDESIDLPTDRPT